MIEKSAFIRTEVFYKSRVGFIKLFVFVKVKLNTFLVCKLKCLFWHKEICFNYIKFGYDSIYNILLVFWDHIIKNVIIVDNEKGFLVWEQTMQTKKK